MPTQNILVILHCRALTLGLQSPEPTRFASFSRNLPWPNGKFVASHSEYAYFGTSLLKKAVEELGMDLAGLRLIFLDLDHDRWTPATPVAEFFWQMLGTSPQKSRVL